MLVPACVPFFSPSPLSLTDSPLTPLPLHTHTYHTPLQADFFARAVAIAKAHKTVCEAKGLKKVAEFRGSLQDKDNGSWPKELTALKADVVSFARSFPVVGFDEKTAKY